MTHVIRGIAPPARDGGCLSEGGKPSISLERGADHQVPPDHDHDDGKRLLVAKSLGTADGNAWESNTTAEQNDSTPPNTQLLTWDLDIVKSRVLHGVPITDMVADIGDDMVVKYGRRVRPEEAQAIEFVATKTSGVPVPKVYSVIRDHDTDITYIVQEKLKGVPLVDLLPTLTEFEFNIIADELRDILCALSSLDTAGPMGTFDHNHYNFVFHRFTAYGDWVTPTTKEFVERLPKLLEDSPLSLRATEPGSGAPYDFGRNPIFSHGDFVPENILIHKGRVSGIIDWEHAGWYPYFWNDYVARRRMKLPKFRDGKWLAMVTKIMVSYPNEFKEFRETFKLADMYL